MIVGWIIKLGKKYHLDVIVIKKSYQYTESKAPRTKSWKGNVEYDLMLGDLDYSSLRFLEICYHRKIKEYPITHDMNDKDCVQELRDIILRRSMITDEKKNKLSYIYGSELNQYRGDYFDVETGLVLNEIGEVQYGMYLSEDEDGIIYDTTDNLAVSYFSFSEQPYDDFPIPETRTEIYATWNYTENLNDEENSLQEER